MLTLLRHGESEFNRAHRFTGWADVELTAAGEAEALRAGETLAGRGLVFDRCFTSALRRASRSGEIVLRAMGLEHVPLERTWRLNERHYGALQGLGPFSAVRRYGVLPVLRARRSYDYRPPALRMDVSSASSEALPSAESLADLGARIRPFWEERIAPELAAGRSVLVVSHKHTLRALFALLTGREARRWSRRFATGVPIVVTLDSRLALAAHRALSPIARR
jgi:2,3-bisphosphoglycerate-dependent phosphoglycerate mutase